MISFENIDALQTHLKPVRENGKSIGFVPTMGALHEGHLSLVEAAKKECGFVVVSIFVNPTQFNSNEDLEKYPRTLEKDKKMLAQVGCDIVFTPTIEEMYPKGISENTTAQLDIGNITTLLEGAHRPGHFEGMMQIVSLLLDTVQPSHLYMGLKDYQQFAIVSLMIAAQNRTVIMRGMPIVREPHGLAMSSRNERLNPKTREQAKVIYETLTFVKSQKEHFLIDELEKIAETRINKAPGAKVEYFEIVDATTLERTSNETKENLIALTAVWFDGVRLIDNMIL